MATDPWAGLSKRDLIKGIQELDERRQAQIARQVDSINRLLGYVSDGKPGVYRYEHELMTLNEQLALADVRVAQMKVALIKIRQMVGDRAKMGPFTGPWPRFLKRLEAVLVDEAGLAPYDDGHGRTSEDDKPTDEQDLAGSEQEVERSDH